MTFDRHITLLRELAQRDVPASIDTWPAVRAGVAAPRRRLMWRQYSVRVAAVTTVVLALAAATLLSTTGSEVVSAESLLDRAGAVGDGLAGTARTYHITAKTTFRPGVSQFVGPSVQQEETWFGGNGHMRQDVHTPEWTTVTISNGTQSWWTVTRTGQTYATPANGLRFSDTARLNPLAPEGTTIASVVALLRKSGCGSADLRGEETVAGRAAYVVTVTHTLKSGCGDSLQALVQPSPSPAEKSDPAAMATMEARVREKQSAVATMSAARPPEKAPAGAVQHAPGPAPASSGEKSEPVIRKLVDGAQLAELERMLSTSLTDTFWIDKQTFVQLKSEINAGAKGTFVYEVTNVTYDVSIPDSIFNYTPPAGVTVVSSPAELKQILATIK